MKAKRQFNRGLSDEFVTEFRSGRFAPLLAAALKSDLDVQIREKYVNLYQDGHSVLALSEHARQPHYRAQIHWKFLESVELPDALSATGNYHRFDATAEFTAAYVQHLPAILANTQPYAKREAIVEQKMIRAGHCSGSPVVFIDRQVQVHGIQKRADIVGLAASGRFAITEAVLHALASGAVLLGGESIDEGVDLTFLHGQHTLGVETITIAGHKSPVRISPQGRKVTDLFVSAVREFILDRL